MPIENNNPKRFPIFFLIIAFIVGVIALILWFFKGKSGWFVFFKWFLVAIIVATIIFLIVLAVWWLFRKLPTDAIYMNKQRIIKACMLNPPVGMQLLYFKGTEEWEYKLIGQVIGVCQIKNYKGETEDCIAFKRGKGGILSLFQTTEVVRVTRDERTSLNADRIFLKSMAFTPELFGFYYISNRFRDTKKIDKQISEEIHRYTLQNVLKEEITIVDDAIAVSPEHQKELQKTQFQAISLGQQQGQPPA